MKKIVLFSIIGLFSLQLKAQNRELGIYLSPLGAGYTNWVYQYSPETGGIIPRKGNGFNGNMSGHITYRFSRLRVGVEGGFNYTYIDNVQNLPTVADATAWGMQRRNITYGGARAGLDLLQLPFFTLSPNLSLGLFGFDRDDFEEEARRRFYVKYGMMFEFRLLPQFSVFLEPNYQKFKYRAVQNSTSESTFQNNYNLNLGVGIRL